jgi:hypothetical protein
MSEYRKQMGVAVTIAIIGALSLAIVANYSFPAQQGGTATATQSSSTVSAIPGPTVTTTTSGSETVTTSSTTVTTLPPSSTLTQNATTVYPVANNGVNFTEAVSVAFSSPSVQGYWNKNVNSTQGYGVGPVVKGQDGSSLVFVTFSVTDGRAISGNWSSEYSLTYSQRFNLNVTVEFTPPSAYQVINVGIQDLPNFNQSISFTSQQMQIIQVALSNSTIKQYTAQSEYYVQSVTFFPNSGNETFAGDYQVNIGQVNGSCEIQVFVNPTTNSVVTPMTTRGWVCN